MKNFHFKPYLIFTQCLVIFSLNSFSIPLLSSATTVTLKETNLADLANAVHIDMKKLPADTTPKPPTATELDGSCAMPGTLSDRNIIDHPAYFENIFNYEALWKFSTGKGQTVAVLDTGVSDSNRFKKLIPGGDYVSSAGNGLQDCDLHGTAVAGLIAAKPLPEIDKFSGIAPDASILSIRNVSNYYKEKNGGGDDNNKLGSGYGDINSLAAAVVHAVNLNASVINISQVACKKNGDPLRDGALGAAIKYAFEKNVVVVVAAGNVGDNNCNANPLASNPSASPKQAWATQPTIATPARFAPYAITVGAVDKEGNPWENSLAGPWVTLAAPGTDIVSVNGKYKSHSSASQLIDHFRQENTGLIGINGTSFAAPLVSGVVALLRAQHPEYSAKKVMEILTETATGTNHDNKLGYGVVDPLAALTFSQKDIQKNQEGRINKKIEYAIKPEMGAHTKTKKPILITLGIAMFLGIGTYILFNSVLPKNKKYEDFLD